MRMAEFTGVFFRGTKNLLCLVLLKMPIVGLCVMYMHLMSLNKHVLFQTLS